jgi:hypothetical protein
VKVMAMEEMVWRIKMVWQRRGVKFDRRDLLRRMDEQRRLPFSALLFDLRLFNLVVLSHRRNFN